jgi:deoxyadenosine/deoxycytidine kinase
MVARTHLAICAGKNSVIQDRSIYEDAHIFARALYDMKMLSLRDYRGYRERYTVGTPGCENAARCWPDKCMLSRLAFWA